MERGSCLIGHEPFGTRVWLQMPRGNLETIHPRGLLIYRIKAFLDKMDYGRAIKEMRRHRINTNLIYDHNPEVIKFSIIK